MDDLTVIVTGSGAPGIAGTLYSLRNNYDSRHVRVVGTDINPNAVGWYLCDAFRVIPRPAETEAYLDAILALGEDEDAICILPQNTSELGILAENIWKFEKKGVKVAVSPAHAIELSNDKQKLCERAKGWGIPIPESIEVRDEKELREAAISLGWPERKIVVKPPQGSGMRGFRIIDESVDEKARFYAEKPTDESLRMDRLLGILGPSFPPLLVTEHLPGDEYTVDVLAKDTPISIPRKRLAIRQGITFDGQIEKHERIIEWSDLMTSRLGLRYAVGFQFKCDAEGVPKLLECNPRIQGTMVAATFAGANIIYSALKMLLEEPLPEFTVNWDTRFMRYWGGIGIVGGKKGDCI
jgi:carbamoyl-phosphate synthase large subunit